MIAAPGSGHGKTTLATGLMGALRAEGLSVAGFKVGPDYIDPGYHALATGRPGRNLDPHLCRPDQIAPLLLHGAATPEPADVAVVEGVMGLFDGQIGGEGFASTAHVAALIQTPIVLVLDIGHVSRTAAAIVHGLHTFDSRRPAQRGDPQQGRLAPARRRDRVGARGHRPAGARRPAPRRRHRGPVPPPRPGAGRRAGRGGRRRGPAGRAGRRARRPDRGAARSRTPPRPWTPRRGTRTTVVSPPSDRRPVVAVAGGRAFTFRYAETDELLRAAGCEPVVFDPLTDPALPAGTAGLYLGGGFPEVHAAELSANAEPARPRSARRSPPACPPSPSAPGCSTCAAASTAPRWSARCRPTGG